MNFKEELNEKTQRIEAMIKEYLPAEEGYAKTLAEAVNYSIMAGGKRLRPMLMQETYSLFGGSGEVIKPFMAAIEMIHTYSLVHDDLPAMDDDEYRRGRRTTHVLFGEAMALLAGDALLNYAFETASGAFAMEPGSIRVEEAFSILARKAGLYGMIGGQTADIEAEDRESPATQELLLYIHANKTAALIQASMMAGAVLAGASGEDVARIEKIAYNVGIAFQIQDDILDTTGTLEVLGKPVGSDEKNNKATYVTINGVKQAREDVKRLSEEAITLLDLLPGKNTFLEKLLDDLITREK